MFITKKEWTCLHILTWSSTIRILYQRLSSLLPDKTSSSEKTFSAMLQFFRFLFQWKQSLNSLDRKLKRHSAISNLIWDKLEHSEVVSQMWIFKPHIIVAYTLGQWKHWTFKEIYPQFQLIISKTSMYWCLFWFQCKMQEQSFHCPKLVGESLIQELNFTFPPEHVTELNVLGERMPSVAVDMFNVFEKNF